MTSAAHTPASRAPGPPAHPLEWKFAARVLFRWVFAYALFFLASFAGLFAPLTLPVAIVSQAFWTRVIPWVATHILAVPPPPLVSDGDGLGQWIQVGVCAAMATLVTLVWSVADRRRPHYATLHEWLRVILRYALGVAMVFYGLAKLFHLQMLPPHLAKLVQPLGDSSPTSLLWIFMGSSAWYSAFTGAVEILGGVLLFNRRTTTLGALISIGALTQVVALNLSYDVSVKLWSMHLLALTLVLVVPDLGRLAKVFLLNRPIEPTPYSPLFRRAKYNRVAFRVGMTCLAITLALRGLVIANGTGDAYRRTPTALYGIYDVESFTRNGTRVPPLLSDTRRWRMLVIERSGLASIRLMDDAVLDYLTSTDPADRTITFVANPDTTVTTAGATRLAYDPDPIERRFAEAIDTGEATALTLEFSQPTDDTLALTGQWADQAIEVELSRVDESRFLLLNRGFRWVQPYPYFR